MSRKLLPSQSVMCEIVTPPEIAPNATATESVDAPPLAVVHDAAETLCVYVPIRFAVPFFPGAPL